MLSEFWEWIKFEKFENRSIFDEVKTYKRKCASFVGHLVYTSVVAVWDVQYFCSDAKTDTDHANLDWWRWFPGRSAEHPGRRPTTGLCLHSSEHIEVRRSLVTPTLSTWRIVLRRWPNLDGNREPHSLAGRCIHLTGMKYDSVQRGTLYRNAHSRWNTAEFHYATPGDKSTGCNKRPAGFGLNGGGVWLWLKSCCPCILFRNTNSNGVGNRPISKFSYTYKSYI